MINSHKQWQLFYLVAITRVASGEDSQAVFSPTVDFQLFFTGCVAGNLLFVLESDSEGRTISSPVNQCHFRDVSYEKFSKNNPKENRAPTRAGCQHP